MRLLIAICVPQIEFPSDSNEAQFNLNLEEFNTKYAKDLVTHGRAVSILGKHGYEAPTNMSTAAVIAAVEEGKIKYLCQWESKSSNQMKYLVQLNVWQDPSPEWKGFARRMIDWFLDQNDYLLLSDTQYPRGVEMYKTYIKENLHKKYIYLKNNDQHTSISSMEQFNSLIDKIWSKNKSHKNVRVMISNKPLDFNYQ